jgi:hypothetical protein
MWHEQNSLGISKQICPRNFAAGWFYACGTGEVHDPVAMGSTSLRISGSIPNHENAERGFGKLAVTPITEAELKLRKAATRAAHKQTGAQHEHD